MKWCSARVPKGGECVLLQISLRIKFFDFFFKYPKLLHESPLSRHTSKLMEKNIKILENRPQRSKNAQKEINFCKIHNGEKHTLVFGFQ